MTELSSMYININGDLCIDMDKTEMLITAIGSCILGDYFVYIPNNI